MDMEMTEYRLDQIEKRAEAADMRMGRIEDRLTEIKVTLAGLPAKEGVRNWGLAGIAIVVAAIFSLGAVILQSPSTQLAAFQSGLNVIQAVAAAHDVAPGPSKN